MLKYFVPQDGDLLPKTCAFDQNCMYELAPSLDDNVRLGAGQMLLTHFIWLKLTKQMAHWNLSVASIIVIRLFAHIYIASFLINFNTVFFCPSRHVVFSWRVNLNSLLAIRISGHQHRIKCVLKPKNQNNNTTATLFLHTKIHTIYKCKTKFQSQVTCAHFNILKERRFVFVHVSKDDYVR